jgi:hypothetical protein
MSQLPLQATVITQAEPSTNQALLQLALFDLEGAPFVNGNTALADAEPAAFQADFAGADITALKVELNAFLDKLIAAGLMEAS